MLGSSRHLCHGISCWRSSLGLLSVIVNPIEVYNHVISIEKHVIQDRELRKTLAAPECIRF